MNKLLSSFDGITVLATRLRTRGNRKYFNVLNKVSKKYSTVLNVLTYLKVEQYTTKEMKCKEDYGFWCIIIRPLQNPPWRTSSIAIARCSLISDFFLFIAKID